MTIATIQPDATAGIDTYLSNGANAAVNYGAMTTMPIGSVFALGVDVLNRAIIRIDLTTLGRRPIINTATLTLKGVAGGTMTSGSGTFTCRRMSVTDWTEAGATWNTKNGVTAWATAGGDYVATNAATDTLAATGNLEFNVTAMVQAMIDEGLAQADFIVSGVEGVAGVDNYLTFGSSDHAGSASRPSLAVNYTPVPIIEQIALEIFDRLAAVTIAGGYAIDLLPDRPKRNGQFIPRHLLALLAQSDCSLAPEANTGTFPTAIARVQTFEIGCFVFPSEADDTPVETLINLVVAEVERAITAPTSWFTMDDLAIGAQLGAHLPFPPEALEQGFDGKSVQVHVKYRVQETNPYLVG